MVRCVRPANGADVLLERAHGRHAVGTSALVCASQRRECHAAPLRRLGPPRPHRTPLTRMLRRPPGRRTCWGSRGRRARRRGATAGSRCKAAPTWAASTTGAPPPGSASFARRARRWRVLPPRHPSPRGPRRRAARGRGQRLRRRRRLLRLARRRVARHTCAAAPHRASQGGQMHQCRVRSVGGARRAVGVAVCGTSPRMRRTPTRTPTTASPVRSAPPRPADGSWPPAGCPAWIQRNGKAPGGAPHGDPTHGGGNVTALRRRGNARVGGLLRHNRNARRLLRSLLHDASFTNSRSDLRQIIRGPASGG